MMFSRGESCCLLSPNAIAASGLSKGTLLNESAEVDVLDKRQNIKRLQTLNTFLTTVTALVETYDKFNRCNVLMSKLCRPPRLL